jgi:hypothetical protein
MADRQFRLEGKRHAILSVTVNAIGTSLAHAFGKRLRPRFTGIVRALIPHHQGKQDPNAMLVKFGDHLPNTLNAAWHCRDHVKLIAIINAKIGVTRHPQLSARVGSRP